MQEQKFKEIQNSLDKLSYIITTSDIDIHKLKESYNELASNFEDLQAEYIRAQYTKPDQVKPDQIKPDQIEPGQKEKIELLEEHSFLNPLFVIKINEIINYINK